MFNRIETDFYRNSKEMGKMYGKDGGYWESNREMAARAFACYILDRLPYTSDYLVGHAQSAVLSENSGEQLAAYPQGAEREAINRAFDEVIEELKREKVLTHVEPKQASVGARVESVWETPQREDELQKPEQEYAK